MPEPGLLFDQFSLFFDKTITHRFNTQPHHRFGFFRCHHEVCIRKDLFPQLRRDCFIIGYHLRREESIEFCPVIECRLPDIELCLFNLNQVIGDDFGGIAADRLSQLRRKCFDVRTGTRAILKCRIDNAQIPLQRHCFTIVIFIILQRMPYLKRCPDRHPSAIDICPISDQFIRLGMRKCHFHRKQIGDPLLFLIEYNILFLFKHCNKSVQGI